MKLSELKADTSLILEVVTKEKNYPLGVKIDKIFHMTLYIQAITAGEKCLILGKQGIFPNAIYNLIYVSDNQRLEWKALDIETVSIKDIYYYKIIIKPYNNESCNSDRRVDTRINVNLKAKCKTNINDDAIDITINNISLNGLAFFSNINLDILHKNIIIEIEDTLREIEYEIQIPCNVVRTVEPSESTKLFVYGCQVIKPTNIYAKYVNAQRTLELATIKGIDKKQDNKIEQKDTVTVPKKTGFHSTKYTR